MEIQFFEETHTYIVDGEIYPSCTQVLEATGNWPEFYMGPDRDFYLERGQKVHKAIFYIQNSLDVVHQDILKTPSLNKMVEEYILGLDPIIRGYVASWDRLRRDERTCFSVVEFEERVASKDLKVAGTLDAMGVACLFKRTNSFLGDYKCGEDFLEYGYQTAGYTMMRFPVEAEDIERAGIHLQKDGSMPIIIEHKRLTDFDIFKTACELYHQSNRKEGKQCN